MKKITLKVNAIKYVLQRIIFHVNFEYKLAFLMKLLKRLILRHKVELCALVAIVIKHRVFPQNQLPKSFE